MAFRPMTEHPPLAPFADGSTTPRLYLEANGERYIGYQKMRLDDEDPVAFTTGEWEIEPIGWMDLPGGEVTPSTTRRDALADALAMCERISAQHQRDAIVARAAGDRPTSALLIKAGADECVMAIREMMEKAA
jgi:hypothetical protein